MYYSLGRHYPNRYSSQNFVGPKTNDGTHCCDLSMFLAVSFMQRHGSRTLYDGTETANSSGEPTASFSQLSCRRSRTPKPRATDNVTAETAMSAGKATGGLSHRRNRTFKPRPVIDVTSEATPWNTTSVGQLPYRCS
jgi:hypothetical protein